MTGFDAPGRKPLDDQASVAAPDPAVRLGRRRQPSALCDRRPRGRHTPLDERNDRRERHSKSLRGRGAGPARRADLARGPRRRHRRARHARAAQAGRQRHRRGHRSPTSCFAASGSATAPTATPPHLLPLTGAPAIEGATANTTFDSPTFFPQKLATANYFGALGASGRTSLILTPAQYRNDPEIDPTSCPPTPSAPTASLGFRLFYSGDETEAFGGEHSRRSPPRRRSPTSRARSGTDGKVDLPGTGDR